MSAPRILIAEDDPFLQDVLSETLQRAGFEVTCVADGASALVRIKARRPDLLLLDLVLPGVDGFEVLRRVRADAPTRDLPVAVISSLHRPDHLETLRGLGVLTLIPKPFSPSDLVRQLRNLGLQGVAA